ncbi:MAG: ribosome maturation factor RimP [Firmicutes bacterium]|nr:ribosome maturation factor RimP [Bacillota bacterium]
MANDIEKRVFALAEPLCEANGAELVAVEWQKSGREWRLALYIDAEGGVGHELCVNVSHAVSDALDALDFIEPAYNLEVSSPGLERPLLKPADFQRFAGQPAAIKLFAARDGKKEFFGDLLGYSAEEGVSITEEKTGKKLSFATADIAKAHLVFKF